MSFAQLTGLGATDDRELNPLAVGLQKAGDTMLGGDRIDAHLRMTLMPILHPTFKRAVRVLGGSNGRPPRTSMGALRNFPSHAAYSIAASLPGASVIRTTIQLKAGGGRSESLRGASDRTMRLLSELVAVEPKIERA